MAPRKLPPHRLTRCKPRPPSALAGSAASASPNLLESDLRTREKEIIIEAVRNNASRKQAAEKLGISPRTLRYKMARFRKQELAAVLPA